MVRTKINVAPLKDLNGKKLDLRVGDHVMFVPCSIPEHGRDEGAGEGYCNTDIADKGWMGKILHFEDLNEICKFKTIPNVIAVCKTVHPRKKGLPFGLDNLEIIGEDYEAWAIDLVKIKCEQRVI